MKILILGGSGMLGHRLWLNLNRHHETWVTLRGDGSEIPNLTEFPRKYICPYVDARNFDEITRALTSIQPALVINCIGLIKQTNLSQDPIHSISLNALLPHRISLLCRTAGIRMIHISTDCVYSGRKGAYLESEQSDAEDLYGRTKFLGEVHYSHSITLRTSIIGQELNTHLGLIEWFLAQNNYIRGFKKAIYSGLTTDELFRIILNYVIPHPELNGVYHVSSDPISKYSLLTLARKSFHKQVEIMVDNEFQCDRSLDSSRFRQATGYIPPSWTDMIGELAAGSPFYDRLRGN